MKPDQNTRLVDYLEDKLSAEERQELELELAGSAALRDELEQLRRVLAGLSQYPLKQPGPALRKRFYELLEQQQRAVEEPESTHVRKLGRTPRPGQWAWTAAAAVALVAIGIGFGALWQLNIRQEKQIHALVNEIESTRKVMVLSMLEEPSPSQRIKAVNTVQREARGPDPQIIRALFNTLNTDDNVNVRLKAAEALLEFYDYPGVVESLIAALNNQDSPDVQITLIEVLTAVKAKGAVGEFHKILERKEVHEVVRNKAAAGIQQLM